MRLQEKGFAVRTIFVNDTTTLGLFEEIVHELLGDTNKIDHNLITKIYRRHKGNIRLCLRELYALWSTEGFF